MADSQTTSQSLCQVNSGRKKVCIFSMASIHTNLTDSDQSLYCILSAKPEIKGNILFSSEDPIATNVYVGVILSCLPNPDMNISFGT